MYVVKWEPRFIDLRFWDKLMIFLYFYRLLKHFQVPVLQFVALWHFSFLLLQDTAGSERYEAMSRIYYRGAKAAVLCVGKVVWFSVSARNGFVGLYLVVVRCCREGPTNQLFLLHAFIEQEMLFGAHIVFFFFFFFPCSSKYIGIVISLLLAPRSYCKTANF